MNVDSTRQQVILLNMRKQKLDTFTSQQFLIPW